VTFVLLLPVFFVGTESCQWALGLG
jgi:hypothetical protein